MIKDRPASIVTVIGSALVNLGDGTLTLTIYTYEKGSIGFRITLKSIDIIRQALDEAEAQLKRS